MLEDFRQDYAIVTSMPCVWREMDAFQHVNNSVFFTYFENARIVYFEQTQIMGPQADPEVGPILAKTSCKYIRPITFPDTLWVGTSVTEIQESQFSMRYGVWSTQQNHLAALGEAVIVSYHYPNKRKVTLPDSWKTQINQLEARERTSPTPKA
ncbi:MAG: thioesterase family protein [Zetaproteobacteria bacterium]|nr:thioesterase family protein [Zetaproteobacteria bacterium]